MELVCLEGREGEKEKKLNKTKKNRGNGEGIEETKGSGRKDRRKNEG